MNNIMVFNESAEEYDRWFDINKPVYESEILALKKFVPKDALGLEVGVGTGRFSVPFGINVGVEPAQAMAKIAQKRGIKVYEALAEDLPFEDNTFDFVLMVTTICFLQNPLKALKEVKRVLKSEGHIIMGMIDKNSFLGEIYLSKKKKSRFYRNAKFYSPNNVMNWLKKLNYTNFETCQTLFKNPEDITVIEPVKIGYGDGGFTVITAQKKN
jgi:ubiquinone/menaquinone biosynthesis C-methylase UbiE